MIAARLAAWGFIVSNDQEMEVTPAMIDAGWAVLNEYLEPDNEDLDGRGMMARLYRAMAAAS